MMEASDAAVFKTTERSDPKLKELIFKAMEEIVKREQRGAFMVEIYKYIRLVGEDYTILDLKFRTLANLYRDDLFYADPTFSKYSLTRINDNYKTFSE